MTVNGVDEHDSGAGDEDARFTLPVEPTPRSGTSPELLDDEAYGVDDPRIQRNVSPVAHYGDHHVLSGIQTFDFVLHLPLTQMDLTREGRDR